MKRSFTLLLTLVVALWISSLSAAAQGRGSKPMSTGIEHAELKASPEGQRGIDKAEAKQSVHKHAKRRRKLRRLARSWPRERTKPSAPEKRRLTAVPNGGGAESSAAVFLELWALVAFKCPIVLTYCDGNFEGAPQLRGFERQARVP